jgi:hypothetical protein
VKTGRIRGRAGAALAFMLVGVVAAWAMPATAAAQTDTTGQATAAEAGSWWAFGLVLLGLAAAIGGLFFWDLYKTNLRQDKALEFLRKNPKALSESDRARVLDKLTTGTEGLTRGLLGFSLIGLFAIALLYLLIRNPTITNTDVVQNAMAALITLVTAVVSFYYGTRSAQSSNPSVPPLAPGEDVLPPDDGDDGDDGDGAADDVPPPADDVPPPADDGDAPPPADDVPPPADDGDMPQVQGEREPPPEDGDTPPARPSRRRRGS